MQTNGKKTARRLALGSLVGAANSLFGGGGGMLAVPLLEGTGLTRKEAHATAISLVLPVSLLSFFLYALRGYAQFDVLIPVALGVGLGGSLGARLLGRLPVRAVQATFIALQVFAGASLLFL